LVLFKENIMANDRLEVPAKIDSRHPEAMKKDPGLTPWAIKGELILNCNCTVFCPCVVSLGKHAPTEGYCQAWAGVRIDEGHYGDEDLSGLNVGLVLEIPGLMARGNWKAAAYIDERASYAAYEALIKIFSGQAKGTTGLFKVLVSEFLGAERAPVEFTTEVGVADHDSGESSSGAEISGAIGGGTITAGYSSQTLTAGSADLTTAGDSDVFGATYSMSLDADTTVAVGYQNAKDSDSESATRTDLSIERSLGGGASIYLDVRNLSGDTAANADGTAIGFGTSVAF
jgi:hypothetical protein